jgi:pimeloyl-ACP methyl ester carboxylesterase
MKSTHALLPANMPCYLSSGESGVNARLEALHCARTAPATATVKGRVQTCQVAGKPELKYFLYIPTTTSASGAMLVSVHGISRNAREHADLLAPLAEQYGVVLVTPSFSRRDFPDYQRLGRQGMGQRADHALQNMIAEAGHLSGADNRKICLFGYSGGGQFAHRYAMAYPESVRRMVIGAAGWYTYPDDACRFPYGIAPVHRLTGVTFRAENFLQIPALVLVGQWDIKSDPGLNRSARIERRQGHTRLERGRRWVDAMNRAAAAAGLDTPYTFRVMAGCDHDFINSMQQGGMGRYIFRYLFGDSPAAVTGDLQSEVSYDTLGNEP